jgi:hypothetical protein
MIDPPTLVLGVALLVPAFALVGRLPNHLASLFAGRRDGFLFGIATDDGWPRGVQEEPEPGFRWASPPAQDDGPPMTAVVARTASRQREPPDEA